MKKMTIPNQLSLLRIIIVPFMVFFYLAEFIPYCKVIALVLLVVGSLTDFVDGYIARKYNQITTLGKFLDPIADKILINTALLLVVCDGTVPAPYGVIAAAIIISREFIVSTFRIIASGKHVVIAADIYGKIKTFTSCFSMPALFILAILYRYCAGQATLLLAAEIVNWILLGATVLLTVISGINYVVKNWKILDEEKPVEKVEQKKEKTEN